MDESPSAALFDQLRRDASAAAALRVTDARAEAERVRTDANAQLAQRRTAALAERERAHTAALERMRADTRTRTARAWLTARAEVLDRVFGAAHNTLRARVHDPGFVAAVTGGARDALAYLPPGGAVARCATSLAPAVRAALASQTTGQPPITVTADDAAATGVILETPDHALAIDATFARRLDRERPRLAIAIVRQLEVATS